MGFTEPDFVVSSMLKEGLPRGGSRCKAHFKARFKAQGKVRCACVVIVLLLSACNNNSDTESTVPAISLTTELGGIADGFERACEARDFSFPDDHGAHPEYRNEWWYVTGNLSNDEGRKFGFHATFFRIANRLPVEQEDPAQDPAQDTATPAASWSSTSSWAAEQFYMGHFAISEEGSNRAVAHERFSRAAAGLAGATTHPVNVWLDDWRLQERSDSTPDIQSDIENDELARDKKLADESVRHWRLEMASGSESVDLSLQAVKPLVLQGDNGLSFKSAGDCNASYYYSFTRLDVSGDIVNNGVKHSVNGTAWIDREWSSSALADNQVGWDWFALQLKDGRDLMIYQLRKNDGQPDDYSYAVEIDRSGNKKIIPYDQIDIVVKRWWESPTGARYPIAGRIYRADSEETIEYRPLIDNQELPLTVRYWEGAIQLTDGSDTSIGHGYLELTGY